MSDLSDRHSKSELLNKIKRLQEENRVYFINDNHKLRECLEIIRDCCNCGEDEKADDCLKEIDNETKDA